MKAIYLICLLTIVLCCCKKRHTQDNNNNANDTFSYSLSYDSLINAHANTTSNFYFTVKVHSGNIQTNHLACSLTGAPAGISISPGTMDVSQLLGGVFSLNAGNIAMGDYPIQFNVKSLTGGTEIHQLILRIVAPLDYAALLAGSYDSSYDFCPLAGIGSKYGISATTVADTAYLLKLGNFKHLGSSFVVSAWITNVITIPMQTIDGNKIWGNGSFTHDARPGHENHYMMTIYDTMVTGVDTEYCTAHVEH